MSSKRTPLKARTRPLTAAELDELEELRLTRRWTYRELAKAIGLPEATVYKVITKQMNRLRPTTIYPIRLYIESQRGADAAQAGA